MDRLDRNGWVVAAERTAMGRTPALVDRIPAQETTSGVRATLPARMTCQRRRLSIVCARVCFTAGMNSATSFGSKSRSPATLGARGDPRPATPRTDCGVHAGIGRIARNIGSPTRSCTKKPWRPPRSLRRANQAVQHQRPDVPPLRRLITCRNWQWGDLHPAVAQIAAGAWKTKEPPAIRGTGYCIDALEAALWSVAGATNFREAVLRAANLGDDADTTAAIAGQLAGARWGASGIPAAWRGKAVAAERIVALARGLFAAGGGVLRSHR